MGPDELDDLLASIRAEAKEESSGGALALYEGTRETDLVSESIDERILRLIGLEDVFDIDYGTYSTLLRERLAAARMTNSEIASDEDELVRDEFRRVREDGELGESISFIRDEEGNITKMKRYNNFYTKIIPIIYVTV